MNTQPANLRPLKAGEILDRAFRLYRANFWHFIGIAGVLLGPLFVLMLLSQFVFHDTRVVYFIQSILTSYLLYGALIWGASHAYLGKKVTMDDSYRTAQRYFWRFLGVSIREGLAYLPIILVAIVGISFAFSSMAEGWVSRLLILLIAAPYILFFSTRWWFSYPVIIFENLSGSNALKRSWVLTSQGFWHIAVVSIVTSLLTYLVASLPSILIVYAIKQFSIVGEISTALAAVITQLGTMITIPLCTSILVIAYYDMRVRREGFDLQLELESAQQAETAGEQPALVD